MFDQLYDSLYVLHLTSKINLKANSTRTRVKFFFSLILNTNEIDTEIANNNSYEIQNDTWYPAVVSYIEQ